MNGKVGEVQEGSLLSSNALPGLEPSHIHTILLCFPAGKPELAGFVCEFCAMHVCSQHGCMFWDLEARTPGLCTQAYNCGYRVSCPGQGSNPGLAKLEQQAIRRCSAHCPTCKSKLDKGFTLWKPVSNNAVVASLGLDWWAACNIPCFRWRRTALPRSSISRVASL